MGLRQAFASHPAVTRLSEALDLGSAVGYLTFVRPAVAPTPPADFTAAAVNVGGGVAAEGSASDWVGGWWPERRLVGATGLIVAIAAVLYIAPHVRGTNPALNPRNGTRPRISSVAGVTELQLRNATL